MRKRIFPIFSLIRIARTLLKYRLDDIAQATHLHTWLFILRPFSAIHPKAHDMPLPVRIRLALQELGPIFVKLGQVLSTRRDLMPPEYADELALLQDQVQPFDGELARSIIEDSLGGQISDFYQDFDPEPLASASIAQVHTAQLPDGQEVVIKVLRPGVENIIQRDIDLMRALATLAHRYSEEARKIKPLEFVMEFERTIFDELDLQREAANASLLKRHWQDSEELYIPAIYWSHTKDQIMTMERVYGIPVNKKSALIEAGIDLKVLAQRGLKIFYTQVFRDNLFHADMHPGNILVSSHNPDNPQFIALDFGIVGSLSDSDLRYIAENFKALFDRDYRRVSELHIESGWLPADTRVEEFEAAARAVSEPHFSKPLGEISFGELLYNLFRVAKRFDLDIQPQLILLQKTLLNVEGLGRDLDPELDPWTTANPILKQIMAEKYGPKQTLKSLKQKLPIWLEQAPEMPDLIRNYLYQTTHGEIEMTMKSDMLKQLRDENDQGHRRNVYAIVSASFVISTALLLGLDASDTILSLNIPIEAVVTGLLALLALFKALPGRHKNRKGS